MANARVLHEALGKEMASLALGLAEDTGLSSIEKLPGIRFPAVCFPQQLWFWSLHAVRDAAASLRRLRPHLVIASGRKAAMPALAISGEPTVAVQIQNPGIGYAEFDLLVAPGHDRLRGPRVIVTPGAVHRVTQARLPAERYRFLALATMP